MRLKFKFLTIFVIILLLIIICKNSMAVDNVYQSIAMWDEDDNLSLVYRTITQPYKGILTGFESYNKWYKNRKDDFEANWGSYVSKYIIFTKDKIGKYEPNQIDANGEKIRIGYSEFIITAKGYEDFLSDDPSAVASWTANPNNVKHITGVRVTDNSTTPFYRYNYDNKNPTIENVNFGEAAFQAYNKNIMGSIGTKLLFSPLFSNKTNVYKDSVYGDFIYVEPEDNDIEVEGVVPFEFYREMLYKSDERLDLADDENIRPDPGHGTEKTLYLMDVILRPSTVKKLRQYYENHKEQTIYVSAIPYTKNLWSKGTAFYMLTPGAFLFSKARAFDGSGWSPSALGDAKNGLGSGLNLWDNILVLPSSIKKNKKIIVNHIAVNVETNGHKTFNIIQTDEETLYLEREIIKGEQIEFNDGRVYSPVDKLYVNNDYSLSIKNKSELKKLLVSKKVTDDNMTLYIIRASRKETYYRVNRLTTMSDNYIGCTIDKNTNIYNIPSNYIMNKYNACKKDKKDCLFQMNDDENQVIVNMYYETKTKKVTVEHKVCTDAERNIGCHTIGGNKNITIRKNGVEDKLYWNESSNTEVYYVPEGYDIEADKVQSQIYEYKKSIYELINSESRVLKRETIKSDTCVVKAKEADGNSVTITFYYDAKGGTNIKMGKKPDIKIPGILSVLSAVGVDTNCSDGTYSVPTNAKNGTNDVFVGIKNTPTYILAGINVEKKDTKKDDHKVKINLTISFGPNTKKWSIEVPYSLSYYAIQELLMYKYNIAEIYNSGMTNTKGDILFDKNTLTATPKNTSELTLYSKTKDKISYSDTNNWKNYLKTSFKTSYTVPKYDPSDSIEGRYKRDIRYSTVSEIGFSWQPATGSNTLNYGNIVSNNISSYIKAEMSEKYKQIGLDKETEISINLLSKDVFDRIDGNGNNTIEIADIEEKQSATKNAERTIENAGKYYIDKIKNYNEAQKVVEEKEKNEKEEEKKFKSEKEKCVSEIKVIRNCATTIGANGETIEKCETSSANKTCDDCSECVDSRNAYKTAQEDLKNAKVDLEVARFDKEIAKGRYDSAEIALKNAYENEKNALKNFDEAYYIQENLWNVYKKYNTEEISKLIGLNIMFEYSSGNAKLEKTDLMTVKSHKLELKSDTNKALNGRLTGNSSEKIDLEASRPTLSNTQKEYYTKGIKPASWISGIDDGYYKDNKYLIPITRLNGKRILAGKATYKIDTKNRVGSEQAVLDNMYYDIVENKNTNTIEETVFEIASNSTFSKTYGVKEKNSEEFNIYTPLIVEASVNQDIDIIDQTENNKYSNKHVIQSNSTFTVNFNNPKDSVYANNSNKPDDFTSRYKQVTYIKFEFAVTNVKYVGKNGYEQSFGSFEANNWIGPIYGNSVTAVPYLNTTQGQSVTDQTFNYYIISAAVNTKDSWTQQLLRYINTSLDDLKNEDLKNMLNNVCGNEGGGKLSYYADSHGELIIVNRVYDFRVTDLKDLDWKDVFRNNSSSSFVNQHSGIAYYAGLTKWNTKNPLKYNQIIGRTSDEIGASPTRILPLGPYKNTNTSYISAPKMGYRFSFDLKVTGAINNNKYVEISPKFYYVSKDGNTFYTEGNGGIYLFYKNSQGQYVKIRSTNDKYQIQFTPNDGYRSLIETDVRNLNSSVVTLGSLTKLTLKFSETTTTSINDAAITYYGEYKLPNSTIAVKVDNNGNYDINKPLTNGYIGVVFDIKAHESNGVDLVYGKNSYKGQTNTSQWDYEGYLGLSNPGNSYSTSMKLEKGTWKIDNDTYNKIKGTVILYDTDTRASNDFN